MFVKPSIGCKGWPVTLIYASKSNYQWLKNRLVLGNAILSIYLMVLEIKLLHWWMGCFPSEQKVCVVIETACQ